ncbi:hypothetical protein ACP6EK_01885 [Candidatus Caldatribacterium sp. SIUC1]|uniref:hypothetical protein n=1 Tax=Candidatus Caldatribacterium sp. SIUC1 TaxID=3418365 RepID=UPI003F68C91A
MKRIFFVVFALSLFFVALAFAQDEAKLLEEAASLIEAGKIDEAQRILEDVRLALWNRAPMACPVYCFVEKEPESFGVYHRRISSTFVAGETMYVYAEPKNYTILKEGNIYHVFLTVSYAVYDKDGNYLGGEDPWENFRYLVQSPMFEFFMSLSFDFTIDPGEYVLEIKVKDRLSDKETSFRLPFKRI